MGSSGLRVFTQKAVAVACVAASLAVVLTMWLEASAARAASKPVNVSAPTISGVPEESQTLTVVHGSWTGGPSLSYKDQWERCDGSGNKCAAVGNAQTYVPKAADVGHTLVVQETATNAAGASAPANSRPTAIVTIATTTTLASSSSAPVTNGAVTLIATVTAGGGTSAPSGTITFEDGGQPIPGCVGEAIGPPGKSVCTTSFAASTAELAAFFVPSAGSDLGASASSLQPLPIGPDSTTTSLEVSSTAAAGERTTYTAVVAPPPARPGPIEPTGSVRFFDGGQPIVSCPGQVVSKGQATCTVSYAAPGQHSISAQYSGDPNFTGSAATATTQTIVPGPLDPSLTFRAITSTMQWTFYYTPKYTRALSIVVNSATGATVLVTCHGKGCPFVHRTAVVTKTRPCGPKGKRVCPTYGTLKLTPWFAQHHLRIGTHFSIAITRAGWIGKYYWFTVEARRLPHVQIGCLAPGQTSPGRAC